jgi:hypothetical protein
MYADRLTDEHDENNRRFSRPCGRAYNLFVGVHGGVWKRKRATGKEYVKAQTNMNFSFAPLDVKEDYISPFSLVFYILRKL